MIFVRANLVFDIFAEQNNNYHTQNFVDNYCNPTRIHVNTYCFILRPVQRAKTRNWWPRCNCSEGCVGKADSIFLQVVSATRIAISIKLSDLFWLKTV